MILNLLYILLALFGIGFLIFIHELGHYFMARRVGITVEVFAIGFGKAIYEWEHKGVKWKIGWLPFGGYVKMAGTEKKGSLELYQIPGGFFSKKPWDRIKVAAMGPLVNITFAFLAFSLLWAVGGRKKNFSEFTHYVGWVDADSPLYTTAEVRSGDEICSLNGKSFKGFNDLLYAAVLDKQDSRIHGLKVDYDKGTKSAFEYTFSNEGRLKGMERVSQTLSNFGPAGYLIYDRMPSGQANPIQEGFPMQNSGIEYQDRIIWVDGQLIFSSQQLMSVLNEPMVLLAVNRGGETFLTRVPRLKLSDLKLSHEEIGELNDWQFEAGIRKKVGDLFFIPYNLNAQAMVEGPVGYINETSSVKAQFEPGPRAEQEIALERGDRIVAVDGAPVSSSYQLLEKLQTRQVQIIVQKMDKSPVPSWKNADHNFANFSMDQLKTIVHSIGSQKPIWQAGTLRLLNPVTPIRMSEFPLSEEKKAERERQIAEQKKAVETITDPKKKEAALRDLELYQKRFMLGISLQDKQVRYNPTPVELFSNVFQETYRTLLALITGNLSPKMISGPVGIVQVIHYGWTTGVTEALYWLAVISLNLGLLNLLPIPVLDGGYITFALIEIFTKRPIKSQTMERLIIPFVVAIVLLFVYLTYNDISRLIGRFF
ncbi:MAG TPA: site-2 protease family protein [Rhabdochlamydiaceae bacterium]|nr:site-2 protease family protein [Rhabdochlamydiaceae bacterium]